MSGATSVSDIKATLSLDIAKFKAGMDNAKRDLGDVKKGADKASLSFNDLADAMIALGAGTALTGLVKVVRTLADEANNLQSALTGVSQVAQALGHDVKSVTDAAEQLASRGVLSLTESATALKTALATGYDLEQSINLINTLTDAAAYNREAHLQWGESVVTAIQGIKAGNSTLTDSAGITTNLSVMYDRYAKSIGTTAGVLTEAQKAQAAYNGMMEEASLFAGNAEVAMAGYTGVQSDFNKSIETARVELGEAYLPTVQKITEQMTPLIKQFSGWASENKEVVATVTATTAGLLGLATAVGVLTVSVRALNVALGPIGWAITIIGAVVTGIAAYTAAANSASAEAKEFAENQRALNAALEKTNGTLNTAQYTQMQSQMETLNEVMERRNALEAEYQKRMADAESGNGSIENTHAMFELADAIKDVNKELADMGYENVEAADFALRGMKKAINESLGALTELTRQQMQSNIAAADAVNTLEALSSEYDALNKNAKLTEEQKARLADIVKQLKSEYPELITQLDEENRWHIANKDALDGYIKGEKDRVTAAISAAKTVIQAAKTEAEERVRLASEAKAAIEQIEGVKSENAPYLSEGMLGGLNMMTKYVTDKKKNELTNEINQARFEINNANKLLDDLTVGIDAFRTTADSTVTAPDAGKKGGATTRVAKTAEQLAQEAYRSALQQLEIRRLLGDLTEKQEAEKLERLAELYKKYDEIWIDAEGRRQRIANQMAADRERQATETARERFEHSADWITQETRNMTLAGETEEAITQMKLEAWSRVRSRYEKDSEYYKRADTELYNLRVTLMRKTEEAATEASKRARESASTVIKAIDAQKKAELDALNERRKAIRAFYDEQAELIDDGERQRERGDLLAEMDKYRLATSEKGQRHYAELQEKLRKMDLDDQRRALEDERDEKLDALDKQQADVESWYNDLKTLLENYNGDFIAIYQQTEDERFKAFTTTNANILSELERFKTEYAAIMESTTASSANASVMAQMQANSKAWHSAKAAGDADAMRRAAEANQKLGASIGASYSGGSWFSPDGLPLYHNGGIVGQGNFSAGNMLMPDEVTAILREGEVVMTPRQIASLVEGVGGRGGNVTIEKIVGMEVNDAVMEDEIDVRALGRTATDMAAEMRRSALQNTGGSGY